MSLLRRANKGDVMLPTNVNAYRAMAAPWLVDAINADLKKTGEWDKLASNPEELKKIQNKLNNLTLGDNRALFLNTVATRLGLGRYPATGKSLQAVMNAKDDDNIRRFAEAVGLDPNGLYVSTTSPIMKWLQGADFDGDVLEIIDLMTKGSKGATVSNIMNKIFNSTMKRNNAMFSDNVNEKTRAAREQRANQLKDELFGQGKFSLKNSNDIAKYLSIAALESVSMGAPNAVFRNAFQTDFTPDIIEAMIDAEAQYDKN